MKETVTTGISQLQELRNRTGENSKLCLVRLYRPHPKDWYGETKQYLYRVRDGWRRVAMLRKEYEKACAGAGTHPDELHKKLARAEQDMKTVTGEVMDLLNAIPDQNQRKVMAMRYINGETWDRVAEAMDMPQENVKKLHQEALPVLKRVLNKSRYTVRNRSAPNNES